jgi:hypothetical protein
MRRILTTVITMYWMASFAVLAMVCTLELDHGMIEAFRLLGLTHITSAAAEAGGVWLTGTFGIAFGLVSLVFLWALVANFVDESRLGEAEEILRLAFASAGFTLAVLLFSAGMLSVSGVFPTMTVQLGALLVSYIAAHIERVSLSGRGAGEGSASNARIMATHAARNYALRGIGNGHELPGGGR